MTKLFYFSGEGMIYMAGIIGSASGRKNKQDSLLYALYKNKWERCKNCKKKTFEVLISESICQTLKVKIILSNVKPNMVYLEK